MAHPFGSSESAHRSITASTAALFDRLRVVGQFDDGAPHGHAIDRVTVRQRKTGQPVRFEMTEQTREAVDNYISAAEKKPGEFLFAGRRVRSQGITTRQYERLVAEWIASIGLDSSLFGAHSLRRRKATLILLLFKVARSCRSDRCMTAPLPKAELHSSSRYVA